MMHSAAMLPSSHPNIGGIVFVSAICTMFIGYALWMIIRPDSYWATWKRYLHNAKTASPNDWYYAKYGAILRHVTTCNLKRKARLWGVALIVIACLVELLFLRVEFYGPL